MFYFYEIQNLLLFFGIQISKKKNYIFLVFRFQSYNYQVNLVLNFLKLKIWI